MAVDASFVPSSTSTQRSLGTMAQLKRPKRKKQVPALSSAERRRKGDAKYQNLSAAVKMRRRQWDPPKPAKDDADDAEGSLTPAEHVALAVLTGMCHNQNSDPATLLDSDLDVESSTVPEQGLREESPTRGSSVVAIEEHPILVSPPCDIWVTKRHKPLPSSARRERIWEWMGNLQEFADWDSSVRWELEQDSLQRRKLFHHQYQ
ncbi:hypothetical protein B0H14DRAFT_2608614 [Mycena olivaceomarginata]|nr:hypothetical protein B0H14DRAFT_2608614 [Mycena olivaceomarginata]